MKNHVTAGVDGSDESRTAARRAARGALLRQVPLRLVHAVDRLLDPLLPGVGPQSADTWADRAVTEAAEELRPPKCPCPIEHRGASWSTCAPWPTS
ncbi:universal stress protein [Streptomyces yangpuensis]|uniref:universal stress protein n=1 Tax=Streptomyces yangpuensis TaxID=1648182 RepID=UPI003667C1D2